MRVPVLREQVPPPVVVKPPVTRNAVAGATALRATQTSYASHREVQRAANPCGIDGAITSALRPACKLEHRAGAGIGVTSAPYPR
jgi:hypothetical protein